MLSKWNLTTLRVKNYKIFALQLNNMKIKPFNLKAVIHNIYNLGKLNDMIYQLFREATDNYCKN